MPKASPKWEILSNGRWVETDRYIFRSYTGERRKNGQPYRGRVYVLGTKEVSKSPVKKSGGRPKRGFFPGQQVTFVAGTFKGRTGTVRFVGDTGRVFVANIKGGINYDAHGRKSGKALPGTFAEPNEIA